MSNVVNLPVWTPVPYLNDTTAPLELLGLAPILNSFCAHVSAQRSMMLSDHLPQAQHIAGAELPHTYTGKEFEVGTFEYNTTIRDQDIQVLEVIDRYIPGTGMYPIPHGSCPFSTVIYVGAKDGKVGYFNVEKYTACTDGYGYKNTIYNTNYLHSGTYIPKDMKISTSPAWKGSKYALGTNLNTVYISDPRLTEDAFVVSESAAKKLSPLAIGKVNLNINADQLLLNMAGPGEPPKFFPGIGDQVGEDGVMMVVRKPTADSIIHDTHNIDIGRLNPLHDLQYCVPPGATVINVDVVINRKCKVKTNSINTNMYQQLYDYRDHTINYNNAIWEAYQRHCVQGERKVTEAMNTLVTRAVCNLLVDNKRIHGYNKKADITLYKNKDPIPFIYLSVTYAYQRKVTKGFKLTGLYGNKGTVSDVIPDEYMPHDRYGVRADILINPGTTISRMNHGQQYQHFIGRMSIRNIERMRSMSLDGAWDYLLSYMHDCHPNYAALIAEKKTTKPKRDALVKKVLEEGIIYMQMSPFQNGIDTNWVLYMNAMYPTDKTVVDYHVRDRNLNWKKITSKKELRIGPQYWMLLHKMPDDRGVSASHVNPYSSPMKAGMQSKNTTPVVYNPTRRGEDETRKGILISGPDTAARIAGMYANSVPAKNMLYKNLLNNKHPSQIKSIPMSTDEMVQSNTMLGVTRHIFGTFGIEISPPKVETGEVYE